MLFVLCEGPTETFFVSRVLNPWLTAQGKWAVPIAADGLRPFARVRKDILRLLRNPLARVTTLIDYYGTPSDYPGMPHARLPPGNPAAVYGEVARLDLALGVSIGSSRFIPHYMLHEFETLGFVDPAMVEAQRRRFGGATIEPEVRAMLAQCGGRPELVNDDPQTSPSHRLEGLWPQGQYQKTVDSVGIVERIPFAQLQAACPHFNNWTRQL
jgi:hypothetical protein